MIYEYTFEALALTEEQKQVIQMGLAKVEDVSTMISELANKKAKDGWEPLYPFSVPCLWFRREKKTKKKS